jgi:hypothetical protein
MIDRVRELLVGTDTSTRRFPPTVLYSEGWLVRLIVDWYFRQADFRGLLSPQPYATWYSEALLPGPFLHGAKREGYTHADATIGHFALKSARGDIQVMAPGRQLVVIEAKMASPLSAGTTHAQTYNQAARNVACVAHLLSQHGLAAGATDYRSLVLAPRDKIAEHRLDDLLEPEALSGAIARRSAERGDGKAAWVEQVVRPLLHEGTLRARAISWEDVLADMLRSGDAEVSALQRFYEKCREYNGLGA